MSRGWWSHWPCVLIPVLVAGCADDPLVLKGQLQNAQQQQYAMARQNREMQDRAASLDRDNQQLEALLAQSRQKNQVLEDQLAAMREQLTGVSSQLAQVRDQKQATDAKVQTLTASLHRQGGVIITPNSSLQQALPSINNPDIQVRRDGDVIRVELPGNKLFEQGSARLRRDALRTILDAANEIVRLYPNQIIGVEGHTDSDPILGGQYRTNHELSVARATAVYDVLVNQVRIPPNQLFLVGHGPNHPVVSNATPPGKERNRRVELVVYPDKAR